MFNADKILSQLMGNPAAAGFAGGVAGGMLTSKKGRKMGKKALKYGGIAAIGALAYNAYRNHQQNKSLPGGAPPTPTAAPATSSEQLTPPPVDSGFLPNATQPTEVNDFGLLLLRAMISAARADGQLDGDEMQKVLGRADELDLDAESKSRLLDELRAPVDLDTIVEAADTPEKKAEVYAASLMAIEVDTDAERGYLAMLRARLGMEEGLAERIEAEVAAL